MTTPDWGAEERVAALVSAYGCEAPVAVAWIRDQPGGPVRVLAAGQALGVGADTGQAVLTVPSGARGLPLPDGEAARALASLPCWTRIGGVCDALLADARAKQPDTPSVAPSLERVLLSAWLDPFAWLLLAEPATPELVTEMAAAAAHAQFEAEQNRSPRSRLAARRAGARHDELREAGTSGMWRVHLLAGAATPDAAARVARLVASSADLRGLPYGLTPRPVTGPLPDTLIAAAGSGGLPVPRQARSPVTTPAPAADRSGWDTPMSAGPWNSPAPADHQQQWPQPAAGLAPAETYRQEQDQRDTLKPESPFFASTRLVAALVRPPARELPGLRFTLRPEFDVTPETTLTADDDDRGGVLAGTVLDHNRIPAGTLTLPLASLNRHVFVMRRDRRREVPDRPRAAGAGHCGGDPVAGGRAGQGRVPADGRPAAQAPQVIVHPARRPGRTRQQASTRSSPRPALAGPGSRCRPTPTCSGPCSWPRSRPTSRSRRSSPLRLTRCYEQAGWDLVTGQPAAPGIQPAYPGLVDLQAAALAVVDETGYGREVRDNVRGFVTVRIGSLRLGTTGRFLDGGHPLDFGKLLDGERRCWRSRTPATTTTRRS